MFFDDPKQMHSSPLHQIITAEEFEKLLLACTAPNEHGPQAERAVARNRAILWLFYDTGIRASELTNLRLGDFDRQQGVIAIHGKGAKERRIALGQNCLRNLLYYLDYHRPDEQELAQWDHPGEDHLLLSETRQPMTKNGITFLFAQLKKRASITGKCIHPRIFRRTFATRYLELSHDPSSLQKLLGSEAITLIKCSLPPSEAVIEHAKPADSPDDTVPRTSSALRAPRRRGFRYKEERR